MPGHRKRRQSKQTDAFTRGMVIGLKRAVAAPQATCTAILQHVQDILDHSISTRTISRRLVANGLHSCRPLRRLPLTPPNRRQRLEWCRARSTWMTEWHMVVFSDESRFCLSSDSRRVRVWRRRGERSNPAAIVERPTVRQRGIMVWGPIAYDSRSPLLRIQGTMTAQRYVDDVLRPVTLPYLQGVPNALYQQDNARPHTARISQQALQDVQMLPWPPYSPDLSPIEHVWDIIGRRLHALPQPRSEDELWQMVEREWRAIPQDAIRTLIDSLPRRVAACIAVRGGIIEKIPAEQDDAEAFYLPHRPVVKLSSGTTPIRPVFDASSKRNADLVILEIGDMFLAIVLFACAVYRCVHLELVISLTTEYFLMALERFIKRLGRPSTIFSYNRKKFVGANNFFKQIDWKRVSNDGKVKRIEWKFIPPTAAWWEAVMNGRPMTYVSDDPNDLWTISPSMFLKEQIDVEFPECQNMGPNPTTQKLLYLNKLSEELKSRFSKEYLSLLVQRNIRIYNPKLQAGEVVLVGMDNKKRNFWPLAVIEEILFGRDGANRLVKVGVCGIMEIHFGTSARRIGDLMSSDGSVTHRYWSCRAVRPLLREVFASCEVALDLQAWLFVVGLNSEAMKLNSVAKATIYKYHLGLEVGNASQHLDLPTLRERTLAVPRR
ncbi:hypothetical protein LAZ67_1007040 [Cordylochernes scorpioides]|uniref:Transposase n=1 Tax=Cordylochernes scorpioides TaxID=51811 RepID=A0ABY6JZ97_9ARAC|nr:hypothetical protein LAZ67_1007040 [Cordylochernes scorpioides]